LLLILNYKVTFSLYEKLEKFQFYTVIHSDGEITGEVIHEEIKCVGGSDEEFAVVHF
jgi:hypothetical protein